MTLIPVHRVLMSADSVGGVLDYAFELSRALSQSGISVALAVIGPAMSQERRREAAGIPGLTIHKGDFPLEWMADPEAGLERAGAWLLDLERRTEPDIVHLNHYCHAALRWAAPVLVVAHSCVRTWWRAVHGTDAPGEWDAYAARVKAGLEGADAIVAPTAAILEALEGAYGLSLRGRVIPNGRSARDYPPGAKGLYVFAAGRAWDKAKNLATLDAAAHGLSWPVLAAGPLVAPDGTQARFENLVPLGFLENTEMRTRLAEAAIFAAPALYEPFGLAILEAALAGCALALGDIPTLRELWDGAALFVDPRDPKELRMVLERLIADPDLRSHLARLAAEHARAYSTERMTASYLDLYRDLIEADRAHPARMRSCVS